MCVTLNAIDDDVPQEDNFCLTLYANEERIADIQRKIILSNIGHKDDVVLEPCSNGRRQNIASLEGLPTPTYTRTPVYS